MVHRQKFIWMVRWRVQQTVLAKVGKKLRRWKKEGLADTGKGRLTVVHKVVEEEGGKIEEWNEEDNIENITDPIEEL